MSGRLNLAVIESRWWNEGNDSVKGVFDTLAGIVVGNPFGYHYEMFNTEDSIKEMVPRIARRKDIHHIYVAAHGDKRSIHGPGNTRISRTILANVLNEFHAKQLYGVFFASCDFGWNVDRLLNHSSATWLAGYATKIDWVHATALDLYFWYAYYQSGAAEIKRKEDRAMNMLILLTALWIRVPYLFRELGLRVALADGDVYASFPEDFFHDEKLDPLPNHREIFGRVMDYINDSEEPGAWPLRGDLGL